MNAAVVFSVERPRADPFIICRFRFLLQEKLKARDKTKTARRRGASLRGHKKGKQS